MARGRDTLSSFSPISAFTTASCFCRPSHSRQGFSPPPRQWPQDDLRPTCPFFPRLNPIRQFPAQHLSLFQPFRPLPSLRFNIHAQYACDIVIARRYSLCSARFLPVRACFPSLEVAEWREILAHRFQPPFSWTRIFQAHRGKFDCLFFPRPLSPFSLFGWPICKKMSTSSDRLCFLSRGRCVPFSNDEALKRPLFFAFCRHLPRCVIYSHFCGFRGSKQDVEGFPFLYNVGRPTLSRYSALFS